MESSKVTFVAGHKGMVGSAIVRALKESGTSNIVTRTSKELDLRNRTEVDQFFKQEKPEVVYLAAAKVGGCYHLSWFDAVCGGVLLCYGCRKLLERG